MWIASNASQPSQKSLFQMAQISSASGLFLPKTALTYVHFFGARTARVDVDLELLAAFVYPNGRLNVFTRRCIGRMVHHHEDCHNTRYYHIVVVVSISLAVEIAVRLLRS